MDKNKPRKIGTARKQKDRKAMRGQINELEITNIKLQKKAEEYHSQYHLCEAKLLSHKAIINQLQAENKRLKEANELFGCPGCPTFKECQFAEKCRQCWNLGEMAREVKERKALQEKK